MRKLKFSPGEWSEELFKYAKTGAVGVEQSLGDYGNEVANDVMEAGQKWVSSFTVVIGTAGGASNGRVVRDLVPATGVLVRLKGDMYGILTAAHVLKRGDNTRVRAGVTVLVPPMDRNWESDVRGIELDPRPCTVVGFDNESDDGPDIAIVPLALAEWRNLERLGMVAYNLDKKRWSDEEKKRLVATNPWVLSIVNGVRYKASEIISRHTNGNRESLAIMALNTRVEVVRERDGYDYLDLPLDLTEHSYPTHWANELPRTAAEEIEELDQKGITRRAWGGISGAGVWNLVIGTNDDSLPEGTVLAELAGICFYANPKKGCIIAHGTESISKIAISHAEQVALRYHSKK